MTEPSAPGAVNPASPALASFGKSHSFLLQKIPLNRPGSSKATNTGSSPRAHRSYPAQHGSAQAPTPSVTPTDAPLHPAESNKENIRPPHIDPRPSKHNSAPPALNPTDVATGLKSALNQYTGTPQPGQQRGHAQSPSSAPRRDSLRQPSYASVNLATPAPPQGRVQQHNSLPLARNFSSNNSEWPAPLNSTASMGVGEPAGRPRLTSKNLDSLQHSLPPPRASQPPPSGARDDRIVPPHASPRKPSQQGPRLSPSVDAHPHDRRVSLQHLPSSGVPLRPMPSLADGPADPYPSRVDGRRSSRDDARRPSMDGGPLASRVGQGVFAAPPSVPPSSRVRSQASDPKQLTPTPATETDEPAPQRVASTPAQTPRRLSGYSSRPPPLQPAPQEPTQRADVPTPPLSVNPPAKPMSHVSRSSAGKGPPDEVAETEPAGSPSHREATLAQKPSMVSFASHSSGTEVVDYLPMSAPLSKSVVDDVAARLRDGNVLGGVGAGGGDRGGAGAQPNGPKNDVGGGGGGDGDASILHGPNRTPVASHRVSPLRPRASSPDGPARPSLTAGVPVVPALAGHSPATRPQHTPGVGRDPSPQSQVPEPLVQPYDVSSAPQYTTPYAAQTLSPPMPQLTPQPFSAPPSLRVHDITRQVTYPVRLAPAASPAHSSLRRVQAPPQSPSHSAHPLSPGGQPPPGPQYTPRGVDWRDYLPATQQGARQGITTPKPQATASPVDTLLTPHASVTSVSKFDSFPSAGRGHPAQPALRPPPPLEKNPARAQLSSPAAGAPLQPFSHAQRALGRPADTPAFVPARSPRAAVRDPRVRGPPPLEVNPAARNRPAPYTHELTPLIVQRVPPAEEAPAAKKVTVVPASPARTQTPLPFEQLDPDAEVKRDPSLPPAGKRSPNTKRDGSQAVARGGEDRRTFAEPDPKQSPTRNRRVNIAAYPEVAQHLEVRDRHTPPRGRGDNPEEPYSPGLIDRAGTAPQPPLAQLQQPRPPAMEEGGLGSPRRNPPSRGSSPAQAPVPPPSIPPPQHPPPLERVSRVPPASPAHSAVETEPGLPHDDARSYSGSAVPHARVLPPPPSLPRDPLAHPPYVPRGSRTPAKQPGSPRPAPSSTPADSHVNPPGRSITPQTLTSSPSGSKYKISQRFSDSEMVPDGRPFSVNERFPMAPPERTESTLRPTDHHHLVDPVERELHLVGGSFGISYQKTPGGVFIDGLVPGGAAEAAGLPAKGRLVRINYINIRSEQDLRAARSLSLGNPNAPVHIVVDVGVSPPRERTKKLKPDVGRLVTTIADKEKMIKYVRAHEELSCGTREEIESYQRVAGQQGVVTDQDLEDATVLVNFPALSLQAWLPNTCIVEQGTKASSLKLPTRRPLGGKDYGLRYDDPQAKTSQSPSAAGRRPQNEQRKKVSVRDPSVLESGLPLVDPLIEINTLDPNRDLAILRLRNPDREMSPIPERLDYSPERVNHDTNQLINNIRLENIVGPPDRIENYVIRGDEDLLQTGLDLAPEDAQAGAYVFPAEDLSGAASGVPDGAGGAGSSEAAPYGFNPSSDGIYLRDRVDDDRRELQPAAALFPPPWYQPPPSEEEDGALEEDFIDEEDQEEYLKKLEDFRERMKNYYKKTKDKDPGLYERYVEDMLNEGKCPEVLTPDFEEELRRMKTGLPPFDEDDDAPPPAAGAEGDPVAIAVTPPPGNDAPPVAEPTVTPPPAEPTEEELAAQREQEEFEAKLEAFDEEMVQYRETIDEDAYRSHLENLLAKELMPDERKDFYNKQLDMLKSGTKLEDLPKKPKKDAKKPKPKGKKGKKKK